MSTILEKPVSINRTVAISLSQAKAIEDPARTKIIELLYKKQLNAEQISKQLAKSGHKKALTTVRHHLDILKSSGLIEIVKIEESRGAITKFYGTSTRLLDYEVPQDFDAKYASVVESTVGKIEKLLQSISKKSDLKNKKSDKNSGFSEHVLLEIVNRAMTQVLEKPKN